MMIRDRHLLFPLLAIAFADVACGGLVDIGARRSSAPDGEAPAPSGPDPSAIPIAPAATSTTCTPEVATDELLLDTANEWSGGGRLTGFAGDGEHAFLGLNVIANFQAGRVVALPKPPGSTDLVANVSPDVVDFVGVAKDRVILTVSGSGTGRLVAAATPNAPEASLGTPPVTLFAASPARADVAYVAGFDGSKDTPVWLWDGGAASSLAMSIWAGVAPRAVAVDATHTLALAEDRRIDTLVPEVVVLAAAPGPSDPAPTRVARSRNGLLRSNLATDGTSAYFVLATNAVQVIRVPLGGADEIDVGPTRAIGTLTGIEGQETRIAVDEAFVYVASSPPGACPNAACEAPVSIWRLPKVPLTGANEPILVKSFMALSQRTFPTFAIDACFLYWSDGARFYRRSKSRLTE